MDYIQANTIILVDKYIEFFSLFILQDQTFINVNPYLQACSIITASRISASIAPIWPDEMIQLTGL